MTMTGKYSEGVRRETQDEMNERYEWEKKKAINEQMNEQDTYHFFCIGWKEKGNDTMNGNEGEGIMNGERELTWLWMEPTEKTHLARCIVCVFTCRAAFMAAKLPEAHSTPLLTGIAQKST